MLNIENSFFIQHWEFVIIFVSIAYFVIRLRGDQKRPDAKRPVNDDETIENDATDADKSVDSDGFFPSLEDVDHVPYKGASVTLKGGVNEFYDMSNDRRSVRMFSNKPVDIDIVKKCILAAGTSPSGAHTEPWTFCLVQR